MNKDDFLRRLEALLSDISDEERAEAMAFYRSYFEDAGEGNEAKILVELESPEKVAETIKKDLGMVTVVNNSGNTADTGYAYNTAGNEGYADAGNSGSYHTNQSYGTYDNGNKQPEKKDNTVVIVLVVILAIATSPAWLGVIGAVVGTLFGLLVSVAAVTIALIASAIGLMIGGISCLAVGMVSTGFALMGASLFVLAFGILALIACVWVYGSFLPWIVKSIVKLVKKITGGRKEQMAA